MYPTTLSSNIRRQLIRWWGWLFLGTLLLACVIASRYFGAANIESSGGLLAFRGVMLVSHFGLLSGLLLLPLLLLILAVPHRALNLTVGTIWVTLILCGLLVDTQVFHLYRFHINAGVLNLLFGGAAFETFVFPPEMYAQATWIFLTVLATVAAMVWLAWRAVERVSASNGFAKRAAIVIAVCTFTFHGIHVWADAVAQDAIVKQTEVLPFRYAATAKRMLRRMGVDVRPRAQLKATQQDDEGLAYPLRPVQCNAVTSPPNFIFIVIDSWRFDAIGPRVTPNLNAFADRTVRFTNHFSGGNATRIGVFSLFYSIPGTYWHRILAEQQRPVWVDELVRRKYEIAVLRSAPLYSPEFDRTVFAGLDVRTRSKGSRPYQWDRDLTTEFESFLDARNTNTPFFAFLFYDSPHSFDMPNDYATPFMPNGPRVNYLDLHGLKDATPFVNRYLNSVHYVDSLVGEALQDIESRGLLQNSVIVITGDHGQEFNDSKQDYWGHGSNFTRYQTGVPFMLYAPDQAPREYAHRTSHFDLAPTLLANYLGCETPMADYSVGTSLFTPGGRDVLLMSEYADFAIVEPERIAVVREHGMNIVDSENAEIDDATLAPQVIATALEQKRRFYGNEEEGE
jgi:uncharacterized protein